jgi:hypothetical protein
MGTSLLVFAIAAGTVGAYVPGDTAKKQNEVFEKYWGTPFVWKFDELPKKAVVPAFRVPYSGHIYPDRQGGTASALRKYDAAFNRGRSSAAAHEGWDTTAFKDKIPRAGLFGRIGMTKMGTPHWHGHCNGWAAAAMRHAEPQQSVRMNGVTFTPADIKGLLAEIYIYNDTITMTPIERPLNAGVFHAMITNWVGRGAHPIGMEEDPTKEKWNYPIYAYASNSAKRGSNRVEVKMNIAYAKDSNGEYQESPRIQRIKYFHYTLTLDRNGKIVGGQFHNDSARIDFLWIPIRPKPSRAKGNEMGNPYVSVDRVLAIWRASVPKEEREKWLVIDPHPADRVLQVADVETLLPLQDPDGSRTAITVVKTEDAESTTESGDVEAAESEVTDADDPETQPEVADASEDAAPEPDEEASPEATAEEVAEAEEAEEETVPDHGVATPEMDPAEADVAASREREDVAENDSRRARRLRRRR